MNFKEEKQKRNQYLLDVYKAAKQEYPASPSSVLFGLSRTRQFNRITREFINNDDERGGYIIGEQIGLTKDEVDAIVIYFSDGEVGYMSSTLGLGMCNITPRGILYLESLEEPIHVPFQITNNTITVRDINSPTLFQQNTSSSNQTQTIQYSPENVIKLFELLKSDSENLTVDQREELITEIDYSSKQLNKGKDISTHLKNIGAFIKDVGINVFANLLASPIYEIVKPALGLF